MFVYIQVSKRRFTAPSKKLAAAHTPEQFEVFSPDHDVVLRLQRRSAYPGTYLTADTAAVRAGYGNPARGDTAEFLAIDLTAQSLTVARDHFGTLPIYYCEMADRLIITNSYQELVQLQSAATTDTQFFVDTVASELAYNRRTPVAGIHRLLEDETLIYDAAGLAVHRGTGRSWRQSSDLAPSDPNQFRATLETSFTQFYETRLHGQAYAFQVSGGLDSSTLPLFLHSHIPERPRLFSMRLPGEPGLSQTPKLQALVAATGLPLQSSDMDLETDYPFADMVRTQRFTPFASSDEVTYAPSLKAHIQQMQQFGVTVLAGGVGSDDIFEHIPDAELAYGYGEQTRQARQTKALAPFLTERFRQAYITQAPELPENGVPVLPVSALLTNFMNNMYIEAGIWPVSPFLDEALYNFCQGLPAYLKSNKNIMRMYYQARHFPTEIYNGEKAESMAGYLDDFVQSTTCAELLERFVKSGVGTRLGYVDYPALLRAVEQSKLDGNTEWLFTVLELLGAEISLSATPVLSRP